MTSPIPGYVLDSSVAVRWYVDQVGYEHAREIQAQAVHGQMTLLAPDVLRWELGDVLRKKGVRPGLLDVQDVVDALDGLAAAGVVVHPTAPDDVSGLTRLAVRLGTSLFDAAFVSLSLSTGLTLITADVPLFRAGSGVVSTELLRGVGSPP